MKQQWFQIKSLLHGNFANNKQSDGAGQVAADMDQWTFIS